MSGKGSKKGGHAKELPLAPFRQRLKIGIVGNPQAGLGLRRGVGVVMGVIGLSVMAGFLLLHLLPGAV